MVVCAIVLAFGGFWELEIFFFFFTEKQTLKNDFHGIFKYAFKHYKMKCVTENVLQVKYYTFENKSLLNKQSVNRLPNSN